MPIILNGNGSIQSLVAGGLPTGTVTQATLATPVGGTGPAFSAYLNANQSITNGVATKVNFDIEEFDTNNNFASSRFTPTVAGYYEINSSVLLASAANTQTQTAIYIYKNGSIFKIGTSYVGGGATVNNSTNQQVSCLVNLNGSTDYIEIFALSVGTSNVFFGGSIYTWVTGSLVRAT